MTGTPIMKELKLHFLDMPKETVCLQFLLFSTHQTLINITTKNEMASITMLRKKMLFFLILILSLIGTIQFEGTILLMPNENYLLILIANFGIISYLNISIKKHREGFL